MLFGLLLFLSVLSSCLSNNLTLPNAIQTEWLETEMGAMISFNMCSACNNCTNYCFCGRQYACGEWLPPIDQFQPHLLNWSTIAQTTKRFGGKYAVFTAQHCSGLALYKQNARIYRETGFNYTYGLEFSNFGNGQRDFVQEFVDAFRAEGLKVGMYYSLNYNAYLNVVGGKVLPGPLVAGQQVVPQSTRARHLVLFIAFRSEFRKLCMIKLLLRNNHCHVRLKWQVYLQVRWTESELGDIPAPCWATTNTVGGVIDKSGYRQGDPNGQFWNPAESCTTTTTSDTWFNRPGLEYRSLDSVKDMYHHTVGNNNKLLLNIAPSKTGEINVNASVVYAQLGDYRRCFDTSNAVASGAGTGLVLDIATPSTVINRVVLREYIGGGHRVRAWSVWHLPASGGQRLLGKGLAVGNRRLLVLPQAVDNVLRLEVTDTANSLPPLIREFSAFYCL